MQAKIKLLIRSFLGFLFRMNPFFRLSLKKKLTIFVFHEISDYPSNFLSKYSLALSKEQFEFQVSWIKKNFNLISPDDLVKDKKLPNYSALITFDDGYRGTFDNGLPILKKLEIPAIIFLNLNPILNKTSNVSAIACFFERNKRFVEMAEKEKIYEPYHLNVYPEFLNDFLKNNSFDEAEINAFQGELVDLETLNYWSKEEIFFYGNHLYDHWNACALSNEEFEDQYLINTNFLKQFKNSLDLFAFTNGKPETCFQSKHLDILKNINVNRVFSSINGLNSDSNNFLLGRLSTTERDINENHLWFRIGITNSKIFNS